MTCPGFCGFFFTTYHFHCIYFIIDFDFLAHQRFSEGLPHKVRCLQSCRCESDSQTSTRPVLLWWTSSTKKSSTLNIYCNCKQSTTAWLASMQIDPFQPPSSLWLLYFLWAWDHGELHSCVAAGQLADTFPSTGGYLTSPPSHTLLLPFHAIPQKHSLPIPPTEGNIASLCLSSCCSWSWNTWHQPLAFSHVNYHSPHPGARSHPRKTNQSNEKALLLECGFVTPTVIYISSTGAENMWRPVFIDFRKTLKVIM